MSSPINVRLPQSTHSALDVYIRHMGSRKSTVIAQAVDEWLRLQAHPKIHFVSPVPGARRAALIDGPEVWSVAEAWLQCPEADRTATAVSEMTGLTTDQIETALAYWADNRTEIDQLMAQIHQAQIDQYDAWMRRQALNVLA